MTTRLSKIARLPAPIREQLNRRLHNGELGRTILKWVNKLPKTKTVLTELFDGKAITHQNLSEWRRSGYQDWLMHQQRLEWFDRLTQQEKELEAHDQCGDTFETLSRFFVFEIAQSFTAMLTIKNPHDRSVQLQNLTHQFVRLQNAYNWSRRVQLEFDKLQYESGNDEPTPADIAASDASFIARKNLELAPLGPPASPRPVEISQSETISPSPAQPACRTVSVSETVPPNLGAPASRRPVDAPESGTIPLAPVAPAPRPLEPGNSLELEVLPPAPTPEPKTQQTIECQTIPTYSPPTHTLPTINHQVIKPRPHVSPPPIRGRRFVCVEG
jgi:hypothetical protein